MKNWIALVAITISFAVVAQHGNKGKGGPGGGKGGHAPKMHQGGKMQPGKQNGNKMHKQKGHSDNGHGKSMYKSKHHYERGHVNHVYMYAYTPFIYPTRNYGQWRSQQARNKHKAYPVALELNVLNGILMIQERNAFVLLEVDRKIERYHSLVIERHRAGLISDVQFSVHLGNVKKMKKRRGHYDY